MTFRARIQRDERGASLVLAIVFMVLAGAIGAGLTTSVGSGILDSHASAITRDRQYAAEGAIDRAIAQLRGGPNPASIGLEACGPFPVETFPLEGDVTANIRVECKPAPEVNSALAVRHNVILVACTDVGQPCDDANGKSPALIRAQINFAVSGTTPAVTRTYVQTWSVH